MFSAILDAPDVPEGAIESVYVACFAGGDATYRIYTPRADEPAVGYFSQV